MDPLSLIIPQVLLVVAGLALLVSIMRDNRKAHGTAFDPTTAFLAGVYAMLTLSVLCRVVELIVRGGAQ